MATQDEQEYLAVRVDEEERIRRELELTEMRLRAASAAASPEADAIKEVARQINGHSGLVPEVVQEATAVMVMGVKIPRRVVWIKLPEPYSELQLKVWLNFPRRFREELSEATTEDGIRAVLMKIVLEHNGWLDEDDAGDESTLPQPSSPEFWSRISDEVFAVFMLILKREIDNIPNFARSIASN